MFMLIKNGNIVADDWKTLKLAADESPLNVKLPVGPVLVPLAVWKARRTELVHREYEHGWPLGIWLSAEEGPEGLESDIEDFTVIGIEFDRYSDGKSYATARLLRERYGYKGELRAIGDVPRERLSYQYQVGLDAFSIRANQKTATVLSRVFDFNAARQPDPQLAAAAS